MYLVVGMVARDVAGPGVIFSFVFAAVAALFSGTYYATRMELFLKRATNSLFINVFPYFVCWVQVCVTPNLVSECLTLLVQLTCTATSPWANS